MKWSPTPNRCTSNPWPIRINNSFQIQRIGLLATP
ncbi:hypothetical protein K7H08_07720 [Halomonas sp. IOP_6]|nr:hypothetical protein [Halomonas sp. IOP_6]